LAKACAEERRRRNESERREGFREEEEDERVTQSKHDSGFNASRTTT
jgi:hypothetical protein